MCHHDHIRGDRQVTDLFLHLVPDGVTMVADTFGSGASLSSFPVVPSGVGFSSSQRPCRLNVSWQVPQLLPCCKLDLQPLTLLLLTWVTLFSCMHSGFCLLNPILFYLLVCVALGTFIGSLFVGGDTLGC